MISGFLSLYLLFPGAIIDDYLDGIELNNKPAAHALSDAMCTSMSYGGSDIGWVVERLARTRNESSEIAMSKVLECYKKFICMRFHDTAEIELHLENDSDFYRTLGLISGVTAVVWITFTIATAVLLQFQLFVGRDFEMNYTWVPPAVGMSGVATGVIPAAIFFYATSSLQDEEQKVIRCRQAH